MFGFGGFAGSHRTRGPKQKRSLPRIQKLFTLRWKLRLQWKMEQNLKMYFLDVPLWLSIRRFVYREGCKRSFYSVLRNAASILTQSHRCPQSDSQTFVNSRMERMPPELAEQVIFTNEAGQDDWWRWWPHVFVVEFGLGPTPHPGSQWINQSIQFSERDKKY